MRYGVISDIHSNLEAFEAVLGSMERDGVDQYMCAGDIVGYGADPSGCIKIAVSIKPSGIVAGNHDLGTVGAFDLEYFNDHARTAAEWTAGVLSPEEKIYLGSLRLVYRGDDLEMVHGSLSDPQEFGYIASEDDAFMTFQLMAGSVCFIGHSHIPGIFVQNGDVARFTGAGKARIEDGKKYIINAGSVGQPRDGDPRASYVIYDTNGMTVEIKRVEYDIAGAAKKILKAGLPTRLAERLYEGR